MYWTPNQPDYDDGVFESSPVAAQRASIESEIEECEDQLERLQVAVDAAEDAEAGDTVINGLLNAIADVESQMERLETDLDGLVDEPFEG